MYGLKIEKEYIIDILEGNRSNVASLIDTSIRGRIALIDSNTYEVLGYVKLIETKKITYEEYLLWHITDIISRTKTLEYINNMDFTKLNEPSYSYVLDNPEESDIPLIANPVNENKVWIKFDIENCIRGYTQISLFD